MDIDTAIGSIPEAPTEPLETPQDDSGSLADHEAEFQPDAPRAANVVLDEVEPEPLTRDEAQAVDKVGKFARHRAGSQRATPEDVQEINALTKELRTAEAELLKLDPKALEGSARLNVLRRQIKAVKADLAEKAPKPEVQQKAPEPRRAAASTSFDKKEPDINDFANDPDPVKAWVAAYADWRDERKDHMVAMQREQQERMDAENQAIGQFEQKFADFAKAQPDFEAVTTEFVSTAWMPPVMLTAITRDLVNGPASVYYLAQHPEQFEDLVLLTDQKPVTDNLVAIVQRRLKQLTSSTQAATTGSAPRTPSYVPPRPPNPVRTGPIRAGNELPGDDASLAEHEKAFSRRR